ncbi:hypothetical protein RIF29_16442 [Crotalaria pallida]|uniref:Uncharacterized protein n=1 Tax=Crotalaria pallida TaxID=3830 RepID=A0AAN9FGK9_CROPI
MAEPVKERDTEIDRVKESHGGEEEENGELSHTQLLRSLAELNMLLVSLSLVSFSMDDCMEYEEREHNNVRHKVSAAKTSISRLQTMNGDIHDPKLARKSSSTRFHTTIKDCSYTKTTLDAVDHQSDEDDEGPGP